MSDKPKPRAPRLSPNKRAELISRYSKGESLDDEEYYVMKDKSGRLNVRKRKAKSDSSDGAQEEPKEVKPAPEDQPKKDSKEPKLKAL